MTIKILLLQIMTREYNIIILLYDNTYYISILQVGSFKFLEIYL